MEYEELVPNAPAIAQDTIMSMAKNIKDNVLHMMTALFIVLQPTVLQNPVAHPSFALLKVPNALVIK